MQVAMASKITCTQTSFEVASEALQIFCTTHSATEQRLHYQFGTSITVVSQLPS